MTYSPSTTLMGPSAGVPEDFIALAQERGSARLDDVRAYIVETYRLCKGAGLRAEVVIAQSWHETSVDGIPWRSAWWRERCNPAGIGITGDPVQNAASKQFGDGRIAARAHVVHLWLYAVGQTLPGILAPYEADDPRWDAAIAAGVAGKCRTLGDLAGTWAADRQYGDKIAAHLNRLAPIFSTSQTEGTDMGMKKYRFVGLDRDVWLPDDIRVEVRIVDHPNVRSYQRFTGQTKGTFHDTGNDGTRAEAEYAWLKGGRNGGEAGGYNFIFDSDIIIQTVPLNEITWHAGTPEGNKSWGSEMAYGGGQDFDRLMYVGAALWGGICAAMNWDVDQALVLHQYWYGKYCARQVLNRNAWPALKQGMKDAKARALAAAGAPSYATPIPVPGLTELAGIVKDWGIGAIAVKPRRVRAGKDTPRYQDTNSKGAKVGPNIKKGEEFDVIGEIDFGGGNVWLITPYGTRVVAADTEDVA